MANPDHLRELQVGVENWNAWREKNPDIVPDLSRAMLDDAHLVGINLINADLAEISAKDANFSNADVTRANLVNADLTGAEFTNVECTETNVYGTSFDEANTNGTRLFRTIQKPVEKKPGLRKATPVVIETPLDLPPLPIVAEKASPPPVPDELLQESMAKPPVPEAKVAEELQQTRPQWLSAVIGIVSLCVAIGSYILVKNLTTGYFSKDKQNSESSASNDSSDDSRVQDHIERERLQREKEAERKEQERLALLAEQNGGNPPVFGNPFGNDEPPRNRPNVPDKPDNPVRVQVPRSELEAIENRLKLLGKNSERERLTLETRLMTIVKDINGNRLKFPLGDDKRPDDSEEFLLPTNSINLTKTDGKKVAGTILTVNRQQRVIDFVPDFGEPAFGMPLSGFHKDTAAAIMLLPDNILNASIQSILDSDRISVTDGNTNRYIISLTGIDAPDAGQEYSLDAKAELTRLLLGKKVNVYVTGETPDGHLSAWVFVDGRINVNLKMVLRGAAWVRWPYYSDPALQTAALMAKLNGFGLWRDPEPIEPWEFRNGVTDNSMRDKKPLSEESILYAEAEMSATNLNADSKPFEHPMGAGMKSTAEGVQALFPTVEREWKLKSGETMKGTITGLDLFSSALMFQGGDEPKKVQQEDLYYVDRQFLDQCSVGVLSGKMAKVHDGNTFDLSVKGHELNITLKVRLNASDAPKIDEPGGQEARSELENLLNGKDLQVAITGKQVDGTLLGWVYPSRHYSANYKMILRGKAKLQTKYEDIASFKHAAELADSKESKPKDQSVF